MASLLLPPNVPFDLPLTEKVEGESYPKEGLHDDKYVILKPSLGRIAYKKDGKEVVKFEDNSTTLPIYVGYIGKDKIVFIPSSPMKSMYGTTFSFNKGRNEPEDKANERQTALLKKWSGTGFITILDCSEHHILKKICETFEGCYLTEQELIVLTKPPKFEELNTEEQKVFNELVPRIKDKDTEAGELADESGINDALFNKGLIPDLQEDKPDYINVRKYKRSNLKGEDELVEAMPDDFPELSKLVSIEVPAKKSGGSNYSKGGGYFKPEDRMEFLNKELSKCGFPTGSLREIFSHATTSPENYGTLLLVLNVSGAYPVNFELPSYIGESNTPEPTTQEVEKFVPEPTTTDTTTTFDKWLEDNWSKAKAQGFTAYSKGEVTLSDEWCEKWLSLVDVVDVFNIENKREIKNITSRTLGKSENGFLALEVEELDKIIEHFGQQQELTF